MEIERTTRWAHSAGHTDICYTECGTKLITCGSDGDVRIWPESGDDDPIHTCVGEWSLCVRQKLDKIYVGTDCNNVQILTYPDGEREGILKKFTAHVNQIVMGNDHNLIAIVADDMEVRLIDLDNADLQLSYPGLTGPALSVALCPKQKMIAVSSGDGYLRVWDVKSCELIKEFCCVPRTNSFRNAKLLCRIDFHPVAGQYLAYPENNTVVLLDTVTWLKDRTLSTTKVNAFFSIVQFSPCGKVLAAASDIGDIVIWNFANGKLMGVSRHASSIAVCALVWNPKGNGEIAFSDVSGEMGIIKNFINEANLDDDSSDEADNDVDFGNIEIKSDDDEENENAVSLEKLKREVMGEEEPELNFGRESSMSSVRPRTPEVPLQAVFMPTSTPEHLNPRYLCWNDIGIVRSYGNEDEDGQKSIEVEFHDATFHSSMMMSNFLGYTMGSLSSTVLAVANTNEITVVSLTSGIKDWKSTTDDGIDIQCIAASSNLICLCTSDYLAHVFTIFGIQRAVFSIPGPVVSLATFQHLLLIAYHGSAVRNGDQCISIMLVKFEGMSIQSKILPSTLGPECTLFWMGFTDYGTPAVYDSNGILYMFPLDSNLWFPYCDSKKHRVGLVDGFFVTAVFESNQTVRGIRCKGVNYPGFTPRPLLSELPLQPLFMQSSSEKSQMDANLFTWLTLRVENAEKRLKETALKSFVLSCKNNLEHRAVELIEMLENKQVLALALKYATRMNKGRLVEKLESLATKFTNDYEEETENNVLVLTPSSANVIKPKRNLMLSASSKLVHKSRSVIEQAGDAGKYKNSDTESQDVFSQSLLPVASNLSLSISSTPDISMENSLLEDEPRNPFLKSLKKPKAVVYNPLSLTDKFAGYKDDKEKDKRLKENGEKRKQSDSPADGEKQKEKQRKLDKFMFSKKT